MNESRFIQWKTSNPEGYDELLRRRRKNYADNEEARRKQLAHNAAWREKQKSKSQKRRIPNPKMIEVNGKTVECWSISRVAEHLGVSKQTIANLESVGTIPLNHHVCDSGRRWWPASFIEWLRPFFAARFPVDFPGISAQEFHRRVWTGWAEEQVRGVIPVIATSNRTAIDDDSSETTES